MYGSYGSYSSMSIQTAPMDIYSSSTLRAHDAACAFPSWPRRSSLADHDEQRASSYLSDEDLFPQDLDDDVRSVSSSGSNSPASQSPHVLTEAELLEMQRERHAMQREALRFVLAEKERRRQAMRKQRRGSSGSKKSPKNKLGSMTPIAEANE